MPTPFRGGFPWYPRGAAQDLAVFPPVTASLWIRGILRDHDGVDLQAIDWPRG